MKDKMDRGYIIFEVIDAIEETEASAVASEVEINFTSKNLSKEL